MEYHIVITTIYEQKVFKLQPATINFQRLKRSMSTTVHRAQDLPGAFCPCILRHAGGLEGFLQRKAWASRPGASSSDIIFNRWNTLTLKFGEPLALPKGTLIYAATKSCAFQRSGRHYCQPVCMRSLRVVLWWEYTDQNCTLIRKSFFQPTTTPCGFVKMMFFGLLFGKRKGWNSNPYWNSIQPIFLPVLTHISGGKTPGLY